MTAKNVKKGQWFFVKRTKVWYCKTGENPTYTEAEVIGNDITYSFPHDEEVELQVGDKQIV